MDVEQIRGAEQRLVQIINAFDSSNVATPTMQYVQAVSALLIYGQLEMIDHTLWRIRSEIEDVFIEMREEKESEGTLG